MLEKHISIGMEGYQVIWGSYTLITYMHTFPPKSYRILIINLPETRARGSKTWSFYIEKGLVYLPLRLFQLEFLLFEAGTSHAVHLSSKLL